MHFLLIKLILFNLFKHYGVRLLEWKRLDKHYGVRLFNKPSHWKSRILLVLDIFLIAFICAWYKNPLICIQLESSYFQPT